MFFLLMSFSLVFLDCSECYVGLGAVLRACKALCVTACKKAHTNNIWFDLDVIECFLAEKETINLFLQII